MATPNQDELLDALSLLAGRLNDDFEELLQIKQQALNQSRIDLQRLSPTRRLQNEFQRLDDLSARLERCGLQRLMLEKTRWQALGERLNSLNPNAVLQRGYAIIQKADGKLIKYTRDVEKGEALTVRVSDGAFNVEVK